MKIRRQERRHRFAQTWRRTLLLLAICAVAGLPAAQNLGTARSITVADCVRTRRIASGQIEISGDGKNVVYVVLAPDIATKKNMYLLYVRDTRAEARSNGRLLLQSEYPLARLKWPSRSSRPMVLQRADGRESILEVDTETGSVTTVLSSAESILSFSIDALGDTIAFAKSSTEDLDRPLDVAADYGYPVIFGQGTRAVMSHRAAQHFSAIYVARRRHGATFEIEPTKGSSARLEEVSALSLSPDGRYLVLNYRTDEVPSTWEQNPYVRWCRSEGFAPDTLGMLDLETGTLKTIFNSPSAGWRVPVFWAQDSQGFAVNTMAPVDSAWAKADVAGGPASDGESWPYARTHTFAPDAGSTV